MQPRITHLILTGFVLAAVVNINAQTAGPKNEIEVRGALAIPSGDASFSSNGSDGTVVSFSRDFDLQKEVGFLVRYTHRTENGKHKFLGEFGQTTWNRTTTLSRSFTFLGQTYQSNLDASSKLKLSDFRVMYAYRWGNDKIRIGPMAAMGVVNVRLDVTETTNNGTRSGSGKITKFAATLGYDLDYEPSPRVNITHNLGAIAFQGERFFHVEGALNVFPTTHFGISGGYKAVRYRVEKDDNFLLVKTHGPFFGGIFRF